MKPDRTTPGRGAGPAHGYRCRLGGEASLPPAGWRPAGGPGGSDVLAPPAVEPLPCPFCGRDPVWEHHPDVYEIARLSCGNEACAIQPRTQYLLIEYADGLRDAWNRRTPRALEETPGCTD
jgi:hypothetical protein